MTAHDRDWHDNQDRNTLGYPYSSECVTKPRATVHPGGAITSSTLDLSADNSHGKQVNPSAPWIIATGVCALSIGLALGVALMSHGQITSEGRAIRAEVRMDFQQKISDFEARLRVAEYEASIAKNTAQKLEQKENVR